MLNKNNNPRITSTLQIVTWIEVIVLTAAGVVLFFLPELSKSRWVWQIPPFNSRFLGAVYLGALVPITMLGLVKRWTAARLVLPMEFTFSTVLLVVSLLYLDQFNFQRKITWGWFFLYINIPLISGLHLWAYRRLPPAQANTLPWEWRYYLLAQGIVLNLYGIGLLFNPSTFTAFWPWKIHNFDGQLYSAVFFTLGVGALILSHVAAEKEFFILGLTELVLGFLQIFGLAIADLQLRRVNWFVPGTWLWISIFALLFLSGVAMVRQSRDVCQKYL